MYTRISGSDRHPITPDAENEMVWEHKLYGSGTQVVSQNDCNEPHLYVYGPRLLSDKECCHERSAVCQDLRDFLNGGERPDWLDDLERISEDELRGVDGTSIRSTGPMYDCDPPKLNWKECADEGSQAKRARLIDRVVGLHVR